MKNRTLQTHLIQAVKIGCGSALAIFAAFLLGLPNPSSAGTITLLTLLAQTRRQTLRLAGQRILSFVVTVGLSFVLFHLVDNDYVAFALFMLVEAFVFELLGWQSTLSVNAVIGTHFLISRDFSLAFAFQEFLLVLLGISVALGLNFLQEDKWEQQRLVQCFEKTEQEVRAFLRDIGKELEKDGVSEDFSARSRGLQDWLRDCVELAVRQQENVLVLGDDWLAGHFEMRYAQSALIHEMQHHMGKVGAASSACHMVADFLRQISESEDPQAEFVMVKEAKKKLESLYEKESSFEDHARLLYILHGADEMVVLKDAFLRGFTPDQRDRYSQIKGLLSGSPDRF